LPNGLNTEITQGDPNLIIILCSLYGFGTPYLLHHGQFVIQVKNVADLTRVLDAYNVGDTVELLVQRNDSKVEIKVTLEESA
jgi:hypothetical protein